MTSSFFTFLDVSRWSAAFLVVISHARHLILIDYRDVLHASLFVKAIYFVTGFGDEAVIVFFVISGFLVGGITLERWRRDGANPSEYAISRFARIYTVLIPALLFSMTLDMVGGRWLDGSGIYSHPDSFHTVSITGVITDRLSISTLIGNLFMLQNIAVPVLGSNGPLWSLAYEWWYYCIFCIVAVGFMESTWARAAVSIVALALLAWLLPANLFLMGSFWLMGLALHFIVRRFDRCLHPLIGTFTFFASMIWSRLNHNLNNVLHPESLFAAWGRDLVVAAGFSILASSMAGRNAGPKFAGTHKALADFSYSTYLVHFPMLVFITALLNRQLGIGFVQQPTWITLAYWTAIIVILYAYSYGFSLLTERHTGRFRTWLRAAFLRNAGPLPRG